MTYDVADRHISTRLSNGTTVLTDDTVITYQRDATGRVISRTTDTLNDTDPAVTIRYTVGGSVAAVLDSNNAVVQRTISLPGGVQVAISPGDTTSRWPSTLVKSSSLPYLALLKWDKPSIMTFSPSR